MPRYFFDTSALIKYYHDEIGSPRVQHILAKADSEYFIARLTAVELRSGLAKKVRMGVIAAQDYGQLHTRFRADIDQRLLIRSRCSTPTSQRLATSSTNTG
jgi:predicted nucleic acid-binding protein